MTDTVVGGILKHYGKLGMKWGKSRRVPALIELHLNSRNSTADAALVLQKSDTIKRGLYLKTKKGRAIDKAEAQKRISTDHLLTKELQAKKIKELSNNELQSVIKRKSLERQVRDISFNELSSANKKVLAVLAIGTTVNTAAALIKSPVGQLAIATVKDVVKKNALKTVLDYSI